MRPAVLATSIVLAFAVVPIVATANPGDPSVLQGTLVWLPGTGEPFTVVRAGGGRHFVVDLSAAPPRGTIGGVGDRVSVVGVEGTRPFEIAAIVIGAGDAALPAAPPVGAGPPAASPPTVTAPAPPPAAPERPWRRIDG